MTKIAVDTKEAANTFEPHFIADFNARFAKLSKSDLDTHRPLREEDIKTSLTWCLSLRDEYRILHKTNSFP